MFHWHSRGVYVVLSDRQEMELVRELADSPKDIVGYDCSQSIRSKYEQRIMQYLGNTLQRNPDEFEKRFLLRSAYGPEAVDDLQVLLLGYSRITRRAAWGELEGASFDDTASEAAQYSKSSPVCRITLLGPSRWMWKPFSIIGCLSFPQNTIEKVVGKPGNFVLITSSFSARFGLDRVRISAQ